MNIPSSSMISKKMEPKLHSQPEIVAIIPARGGSKAIPRKNIAPLGGKPLIAHTIAVAMKSKMITKVVVSTDDVQIAEMAVTFGAEVPFMRPQKLADDHASLNEVIAYTIKQLEDMECRCDVIAIMLPTHPFRSVGLVDHLLRLLLDGCTMVFTMREIEVAAASFFNIADDGRLSPVFNSPEEHGIYFRNYGLFTAYNRTLKPAIQGIHIHRLSDPISLIDIDTYEDFAMAEKVFKHNLFDFGLS